jgi:outer membrane protein TolC
MKLVNTYTLILLTTYLGLTSAIGQEQTWSLNQCIDSAMVYNKTIQMARNNIQSGEAQKKEIQSNLLPKLNANADYKYYTNLPYQLMPLSVFGGPEGQFKEAQFGVPHNINASIQFALPLYNPNIYSAIETSKIVLEIKHLEQEKTEEQIFFEVSNLYYNAQILFHQKQFVDSNLQNLQLLLQKTKILNQQGLALGTDVTRIELQCSQLQSQSTILKSKLNQIQQALKLTIGVHPETSFQIETTLTSPIQTNYTHETPIELKLLKTQEQLLQQQIKSTKKSIIPTLSIYGNYGTMGYGYNQNNNSFLNFYPIGFAGLKMNYQIFNGNANKHKINQHQFQLQNIQIQGDLIQEKRKIEIKSAFEQEQVNKQLLETAIKTIDMAKQIFTATLLGHEEGVRNYAEIIQANNTLREAQQNYISILVDTYKNQLLIKQLTGNI